MSSHKEDKKEAQEAGKHKHDEGCECKDCHDNKAMVFAKQFVSAITSRDTQRHFIRAGVEFAMAMENIMRNLPMPEQVKKANDITQDYVQFVIEEAFCAHNPYCKHRKDDELSKVELG